MFIKITNPSIDVYDGDTNQFLGRYNLELSPDAEKELLQWVNNRKPLSSLVMLNLELPEQDGEYALMPARTFPRRGIFRALFTDSDTGIKVPIEMRGTYDMRMRSNIPGIYSAEFSNIIVESMREVDY